MNTEGKQERQVFPIDDVWDIDNPIVDGTFHQLSVQYTTNH